MVEAELNFAYACAVLNEIRNHLAKGGVIKADSTDVFSGYNDPAWQPGALEIIEVAMDNIGAEKALAKVKT